MVLLWFGLSALRTAAQQFGGNPPALRWNQINTDTARVIFPAGLERQALDVAGLVHRIAESTQYTIGGTVRKIDIVLQNQTTLSNGYVALGPFRSEFFLTPTPNSFELGSLPWHKTLALHEYRHVQQNNNFRNGLTKIFYYVFGQEGQALASNLAIPDWFWEGDAVFQETLLSRQGRGRIPFFFNDYRSIWAASKQYSWMKLRNGSYRDLTPDHYRLGYLLVAYGREKYGDTVWKSVTQEASRFRPLFYPFQSAVKRTTGQSFQAFRNEALGHFRDREKVSVKDSAASFARRHRHFTADEEYPQWAGGGKIVYLKSSYRQIPAFYTRNTGTGKENKICVRDVSGDNYFSYRNGKIVYAAFRRDARWGWKNFSVVRIVDAATGRQATLTHRTKYFNPDISADGKRVVVVQMNESGTSAVHFLDAHSGNILSVMPNTGNYVFTFPKFYNSDSIVSAVRNPAGEMALGLFNILNGQAMWLTSFSLMPIAFPQVSSDTVCFTRSEGDREKLFAWIRGKIYRFLPSADNLSTGSYQLAVHNGRAIYSSFTAVGYHLYEAPAVFKEEVVAAAGNTMLALDQLRGQPDFLRDTMHTGYAVSKYPASFRLFNFHSWRPYISDPEYSYSLVSKNILNTLQSELFFTYNRNENFKETGASLAYAGWLPVISGEASYIFDRSSIDNLNRRISWNELNANLGLGVPLNFVHGSFTRQVNLAAALNTQQVYYTGSSKPVFDNKKFNYGELSLSAVNQQVTARQQIYPRFAQAFTAKYRSILNKYTANQLYLGGSVYLPGLFPNHSVVIQAAYQRRDTLKQYDFTNGFPVARGYSDLDYPRMWKLGVNYHFPLVYPDVGFSNIAYLLRVRANAYYDYAQVKSLRTQTLRSFRTFGGEIYFDSKWWNQLPVSFGIRYSRLLDQDLAGRSPNQWELVLPLNLLSR